MRNFDLQQVVLRCSAICALSACGVAQAGLVAHYKLDESTGSTAVNEVVANGGDGAIGSNVVTGAAGIDGGAFQFGGGAMQDDIVDMGNATGIFTPITTSGQYTVSLWLKTDNSTKNRSVAFFMGNNTDSNDYIDVGVAGGSEASDESAYVRMRRDTNTVTAELFSTTAVAPEAVPAEWHHIMFSVDTTAPSGELYIDGVLEGTSTVAGFADLPVLINNLELGRLGRSSPVDGYTGLIDDVQIYDEALGSAAASFLFVNPGTAVPEPTCLMLLAAPLGLLALRRLKD